MANRLLDYLGRNATNTNANTETITITYTYHLNTGLVLSYLDANSQTYSFTYNAAGQRLTRSFPAGAGHTYAWHGDGQLASEIRPDTNTATIHYDTRGLPRAVDWSNPGGAPATPDVLLDFDNAGRLTSASNGASLSGLPASPVLNGAHTTVSRLYDSGGRLQSESSQIAWSGYRTETTPLNVGYTYDLDGRQATVTDPADNITGSTYNHRGQFATVTQQPPGGPVSTFNNYAWTGAGRLGSTWQPISVNSDYTCDAAGEVLSISHKAGGNPFDTSAYGYDSRGRRQYIQRLGGMGDVYSYDAGNQINTTSYNATNLPAGSTGANEIDDYNFDSMGNRTSVVNSSSAGTVTTGYTPNNLNQYSRVAGLTHGHNANGAMTSDGSTAYTWDSQDRLLSTVPTGTINGRKTVNYLYDAFHRRLGKAVTGSGGVEKVIRYAYDQWNPIHEAETNGAGTPSDTRLLVWGPDVSSRLQGAGGVGGLIAQQSAGTWAYYYYDGNGNVTSMVSSAVTATYRYDAFGNVYSATGGMASSNKYRFATKPVDDECVVGGLAYYGYRYYHCALGRWGSRDPKRERGGLNVYCFVRNKAVLRVDRLGLDLWNAPQMPPDFSDNDSLWDAKPMVDHIPFGDIFGDAGDQSMGGVGEWATYTDDEQEEPEEPEEEEEPDDRQGKLVPNHGWIPPHHHPDPGAPLQPWNVVGEDGTAVSVTTSP